MRAAGLTDVGCKRSMNQDAFFMNPETQLYIVADGMGGHKAGDLASKMALEFIRQYFDEIDAEDLGNIPEAKALKREEERCRKAVQHANRSIYQKANESMDFHGMGTTVVLLKITHGHAILAHVGDSRIYRIQDEEIEQVTKDHSRLQELIDQERITPEEAERYPLKNVITRALGGAPEVEVDTGVIPLGNNDLFLLCSDGLSGVLTDEESLELICSNPGDPEESSRRLIQSTLDRGAPDNVTVIICDTRAYTGGEPSSPPLDSFPDSDAGPGALRKFIDRWFKGNQPA